MSFVAAVPSWRRRFRLPVDDEWRVKCHTATRVRPLTTQSRALGIPLLSDLVPVGIAPG